MAQKGQQNSSPNPLTQPGNGLSQKDIYDVLNKGVLFTMEDDLRDAQRIFKAKAQLIPRSKASKQEAPSLTSPLPQSGKEEPRVLAFQKNGQKAKEEPLKQDEHFFKPKPLSNAPVLISQERGEKIKPTEKKGWDETASSTLSRKEDAPAQSKEAAEKQDEEPPARSSVGQQAVSLSDLLSFLEKNGKLVKDFLSIRKREILQKLSALSQEKTPLLQKRAQTAVLLEKAQETLLVWEKKDDQAIQDIKAVEEAEKKEGDFAKKHILEQKRWELEQKRKEIAEKRWSSEEETEKLKMAVGKIEHFFQKIESQESELTKEKSECGLLEDLLGLQEKLALEKNKLNTKTKTDDLGLEEKTGNIERQMDPLKRQIAEIKAKEEAIEKETADLFKKEEAATAPQERRKWGQERWQAQEKRKILENKRWQAEQNVQALEKEFTLVNSQREKIIQSIQVFNQQIEEKGGVFLSSKNKFLDRVKEELFKSAMSTKAALATKPPAQEALAKNNSSNPDRDVAGGSAPLVQEVLTQGEPHREQERQIQEADRKKQQEFIDKVTREKAAKIQQDITNEETIVAREQEEKLQEIKRQAQSPRNGGRQPLKGPLIKEEILKKLTSVSEKEEAQRRDFLLRVAGKKVFSKQSANYIDHNGPLVSLAKKHSTLQKVFVRMIVVLFLLLVLIAIGFAIYSFMLKGEGLPAPISPPGDGISNLPTTTAPIVPPEEPIATTSPVATEPIIEEPVITEPLFVFESEKIFNFTLKEELGELLRLALAGNIATTSFQRLVFFDKAENQEIVLADLFEQIKVNFPPEFYQAVERMNLFIYQAQSGLRFGLVAQVKLGNNLIAVFKALESKMLSDTEPIFSALGFNGTPLAAFFRASKTSPAFKYQTLTKDDLGICYLIYNQYFVFTASFEAMEKTIERLR